MQGWIPSSCTWRSQKESSYAEEAGAGTIGDIPADENNNQAIVDGTGIISDQTPKDEAVGGETIETETGASDKTDSDKTLSGDVGTGVTEGEGISASNGTEENVTLPVVEPEPVLTPSGDDGAGSDSPADAGSGGNSAPTGDGGSEAGNE